MATAGRILIMPKGEYNESNTYDMLDLVKHNGTSWIAKKKVIGIEPSEANIEYWHKMFDLPDVSTAIEEHKNDTTAHVTSEERERWNSKVDENGTVANATNAVNATKATNATNADTVDGYHVSIVASLPASPDSKTLYFVKE